MAMLLSCRRFVCAVAAGLSLVAAARDIDDQIRYTAYIPFHHDVQMEMGFNLYSWGRGADVDRAIRAKAAEVKALGSVRCRRRRSRS